MYSLCHRVILPTSFRKLPDIWKTLAVSNSKHFYATNKKPIKKSKLPIPAEDGDLPSYFQHRLGIWTKLKEESDENIILQSNKPMKITLPDGSIKKGETWSTTPLGVAKEISHSLANEVLIARVNGELWDLERPFEADSTLELLKFAEPEAQAAFWRSSSFILSEALERAFGGLLCEGAVDDEGFHCDIFHEKKPFTSKEFGKIEGKIVRVLFVKYPFERLELTKNQLLEIFSYNKFKIEQINKLDGDKATAYRCGSFIDICDGPLVRYNKKVAAYRLRKVESVNWNNQKDGAKLQRVHAISFPADKMLKDWVKKQCGRW